MAERQPPQALQIDDVLEQISKDDQEEWEYEYSTTETETFYLTLDLSHPEFMERRERNINYSRSGYYKAKPVNPAPKEPTRSGQRQERDLANDDDEEMLEGDDVQEQSSRRRNKGKGVDRGSPAQPRFAPGQREANVQPQDDIQILDLHSEHPLISYRGRIFEGDWSEIIGTEAILTQRTPTSHPLPALRHLADDIDLLAASSSKILTREKTIRPLQSDETTTRNASLDAVKKEWSIRIPLGKRDREGEKGEQARFLETLMALKKKKGEKDGVTVYARPAGEERGGSAVKTVRQRAKARANEARPARRRRNKRAAPGWTRAGTGLQLGDGGAGDGGGGSSGTVLSTPTPLRWGDLLTPASGQQSRRGEATAGPSRDEGRESEDVQMSE